MLPAKARSEAECTADFIALEDIPARFRLSPISIATGCCPTQIRMDLDEAKLEKQTLAVAHQEEISRLLAVEAELKSQLNEKHRLDIEALSGTIKHLQAELVLAEKNQQLAEFNRKYKRIDLTFLSRRQWSSEYGCALPRFAVYTTKDPLCAIVGTAVYNSTKRNRAPLRAEATVQFFPALFGDYAADMTSLIQHAAIGSLTLVTSANAVHLSQGQVTVDFKSRFVSTISDKTRQTIRDAEDNFETIYLITEAPEWKLNSESCLPLERREKEPLVVGKKHNNFWLIAGPGSSGGDTK